MGDKISEILNRSFLLIFLSPSVSSGSVSSSCLQYVLLLQLKANFKRKDPLQTPETPEAAQGIDIFVQEVEKKPVDVSALRAGMVRLRFLGNALQPGSVPDPQIVASMLDLVRNCSILKLD